MAELTQRQARRIALNAQGLTRPRRHAEPGARQQTMETAPFEKGLYGVSEIITEGFIELIKAGILKRGVPAVTVTEGSCIDAWITRTSAASRVMARLSPITCSRIPASGPMPATV